uniref:Ubiquitin-like domain-containing protein n=1 Tax=Syphacia muris TaxID=451379 RepID=A0A0N5AMS8_9BILA
MTEDLFFEIQRRKTHIFCDAKETAPVLELKKIIEGILKIPPNKMVLKILTEDGRWHALDDSKTLQESGFSQDNAKAQDPATIGLQILGEDEDIIITELSTPPPIADSMRPECKSSE